MATSKKVLFGLPAITALAAVLNAPLTLAETKMPTSVWALTASDQLINVDPANSETIKHSVPISGLVETDEIVGIDYRVAYGDMYALAHTGRIYLVDTTSGAATLIEGSRPVTYLQGKIFGFDFNPAADKLRVVGHGDLNLRLHPDTGAVIDFDKASDGIQIDPKLSFDKDDLNADKKPDIVAAAYTYNNDNEKLTTNFAIDRGLDALLMQGTKEGTQPAVSPNLGILYTIGNLGVGDITDASMDISDINNVALATVTTKENVKTVLIQIDLETGKSTPMGILGHGDQVKAFAIEP